MRVLCFVFEDKIGTDRVLHLLVSYVLTLVLTLALSFVTSEGGTAIALSVLGSMAVGVGKEVWDKCRGNVFDVIDLLFDLIGTMMAAVGMSVFV